jgi:hypothetical protein
MKKECNCKDCKCQDVLDLFDTKEFKSLPRAQRFWIRLKVAFFETISMH